MSLIECVPNFSEGRRQDVIDAIAGALAAVDGVTLLDVSSDVDHNRTVMTLVGSPASLLVAAFRGVQKAAELIDLDHHAGQHPRIGATDVVPFIPLHDATMADCVHLAHVLGRRIAEKLDLPVYFYEAAAQLPERRNLAYVRRQRYEDLRNSIQSDESFQPDFGPKMLTSAGAVAIGARDPLIAFNAYLDTDNVAIAREIARTIRQSGGGLPHLKALGLLVDGHAQVSMNVVDFRQTSLHEIIGTVRAEAAKHGTKVTHTEIVGLVPQAALIDTALAHLGLPAVSRTLILEQRIGTMTGDFRQIPFE